MTKKTWVLAGIGCLAVVLLACVAAALVYFFAGDRVKREVRHLTSGVAPSSRKSGDIYGGYALVSESGGGRPLKNATIVLKFVPPGTLALRATRPEEVLTDVGTFRVSGSAIKLDLPETGKRADGKYTYDGEKLVLPFQMIGDAPGTSTWRKITAGADPLGDASLRFHERAARDGRDAAFQDMIAYLKTQPSVARAKLCGGSTVVVTYRNGYEEFFLSPPMAREERRGGGGSRPSATRAVWRSGEPFNGVLVQRAQFMPMGPPSGPGAGQGSGEAAWLAYEPEPVSHGDAPTERTALILGAFSTLPVLIPGGGGAHYWSFTDKGENLDFIKGCLEHAHYRVDGPITDQAVTVRLLWEKLKDRRWGVFFFSTHGGVLEDDAILATGEEIPIPFRITPETRQEFLDQYFQSWLAPWGNRTLGPELYNQLRDCIVAGVIEDVPFVAVKSRFFRVIGADFSASLVYLSACQSAQTNYFRDAMQPRSFAGWTMEVDTELSADMNQRFFECLKQRTRTDREAMEYAVRSCNTRGWEHKIRAAEPKDKPRMDPHHFVVFRQNKGEPEKFFTQPQIMMIQAVRRQVCTFKGGQGMADTVENLYKYDPHESRINPQFYFQGAFNYQDVPKWQIDEVKGELCGYGGSPARFTLEEK